MSKRSEMLRQQRRSEMERTIQQNLSRMHSLGLARGAYAVSQVIVKKAMNEELSAEERLQDIITFCNKAKNPDEKKEETPAEEQQEAQPDEV